MGETIRISGELKKKLDEMKILKEDTYEDIMWGLVEDRMELNRETLDEIEKARKEIRKGNCHTLEEVKERLSI